MARSFDVALPPAGIPAHDAEQLGGACLVAAGLAQRRPHALPLRELARGGVSGGGWLERLDQGLEL
jgi:hypothetical protein